MLGERIAPERARRIAWTAWALALLVAGWAHAAKVSEERSAFIRWRHQVQEFWQGKNIWDAYVYPNPPILPILLSPLMALPPIVGALAWFALKAAMATVAVLWALRMARERDERLPIWAAALIVGLSLRPILSDLQHGNVNLFILFLVVGALMAWRAGWDVFAGTVLGLAIACKVTPALFIPYFIVKRSWRVVAGALLGAFVFLLVVPSALIGTRFNGLCLASWWHRFVAPFVTGGLINTEEVNQSLVGTLARIFDGLPLLADHALLIVKAASLAVVALLLWLCHAPVSRRDDPRLLGEFALVALAMLLVSERSWKHHFVTLVLPYAYLVARLVARRSPAWIAAALALSALLMAATSTEIGGWFAAGEGHEIALHWGAFTWAALLLFVVTGGQLAAHRPATPRPAVKAPDAARRRPRFRQVLETTAGPSYRG